MKSVINNKSIIIVKNSKFICYTYQVFSINEVNYLLNKIKSKYYDATHCCYAYIVDTIKKSSDDGEPSGTAGIPIYQVLEKNDLNYVLCIVIRYFGKIKLGAGGLVRAYTKAVTETLKDNIIDLIPGFKIKIIFSYDKIKNIDFILKSNLIIDKSFDNDITYIVNVNKNTLDDLKKISNIEITILDNIYLSPTF